MKYYRCFYQSQLVKLVYMLTFNDPASFTVEHMDRGGWLITVKED